jgi:hypothetical protein
MDSLDKESSDNSSDQKSKEILLKSIKVEEPLSKDNAKQNNGIQTDGTYGLGPVVAAINVKKPKAEGKSKQNNGYTTGPGFWT